MNSKQSKKLRKEIRKLFESGDLHSVQDELSQYCAELLEQNKKLKQENDALCTVLEELNKQFEEHKNKEIEDIPEVLK